MLLTDLPHGLLCYLSVCLVLLGFLIVNLIFPSRNSSQILPIHLFPRSFFLSTKQTTLKKKKKHTKKENHQNRNHNIKAKNQSDKTCLNKAKWDKMSTKILLSSFCVGQLLLGLRLHWRNYYSLLPFLGHQGAPAQEWHCP